MEARLFAAKDGAVRLLLLGAVADETPVQECGVILRDDPAFDLDFKLTRGRIDLANAKKDGPAHVRIRFHHQNWELILVDDGSSDRALRQYLTSLGNDDSRIRVFKLESNRKSFYHRVN